MKLMNIADEGAQYKWQLYDLYDKAFPEQEKKPLQVMEQLAADSGTVPYGLSGSHIPGALLSAFILCSSGRYLLISR